MCWISLRTRAHVDMEIGSFFRGKLWKELIAKCSHPEGRCRWQRNEMKLLEMMTYRLINVGILGKCFGLNKNPVILCNIYISINFCWQWKYSYCFPRNWMNVWLQSTWWHYWTLDMKNCNIKEKYWNKFHRYIYWIPISPSNQ